MNRRLLSCGLLIIDDLHASLYFRIGLCYNIATVDMDCFLEKERSGSERRLEMNVIITSGGLCRP